MTDDGAVRIEMRPAELRQLAHVMGVLDEVTVEVGPRIAQAYWSSLARKHQEDR